MSHAIELEPAARPALPCNPALAGVVRMLERVNRALLALSMLAMVITAVVLTYAVVVRYFFRVPTDWQDDATVFMLVGAIFFSCAYVQSYRGHIGIEAIASVLPPAVNAVRLFVVDIASFLFCAFFSWKSWTLLHEAWVDGQTTSSALALPLWIPYSMMALGMTLLTAQLFVQVLMHASTKREAR
ncbi:TRAP transporter small permease [Noviherbaspirillum sp. UKPF54]|uniref:TRAP transporter small permease n=1 Tax=Noviherbaspirillum sp. UKPF54 TaxID=2601898 RepID=UPI0011B13E97|nr:TRAP transporter small permease [Noviherbaspirillum sp. UKPF54]QDZ26665.1 TRAP transporter small permease [Noviherbaspirillum sp. UKPF54]